MYVCICVPTTDNEYRRTRQDALSACSNSSLHAASESCLCVCVCMMTDSLLLVPMPWSHEPPHYIRTNLQSTIAMSWHHNAPQVCWPRSSIGTFHGHRRWLLAYEVTWVLGHIFSHHPEMSVCTRVPIDTRYLSVQIYSHPST